MAQAASESGADDVNVAAVLVLGGRVQPGPVQRGALGRRIEAAREAAERYTEAAIVACGGRAWSGRVEADVIAEALRASGIAGSRILRDRLSSTTVENLIEARHALRRRGLIAGTWLIVTCDWHLPRALVIAEALGLPAQGWPALTPPGKQGLRALRERVLTACDRRRARDQGSA